MRIYICLLIVAGVSLATCQIPTVCSDATSLQTLTCCPATSDGVCGTDTGRGACGSVNLPGYSTETSDVRENWPHYYTQICLCNGNYSGYDCSRCRLGHHGADCSQKTVVARREVSSFSDAEWQTFNNLMRLTREWDSWYQVVLEESRPGNTTLATTNTSLYGLYVWMHHYAAKDSQRGDFPPLDYAHAAPGFTTWHRYHTLWLEWEIQYRLKALGDSDYHLFRLPYWDWRTEIQTGSGISSDDLFSERRLGATINVGGFPQVAGTLIGGGWDTTCWLSLGVICDPRVTTGPLQRCPFTGTDPCNSSNPDWSTLSDVDEAINTDNYDSFPYNLLSLTGYRSVVDFKIGTVTMSECREDRMCQCAPSLDPSCASFGLPATANMHAKVHYILGIGDLASRALLADNEKGTFEDVAASPNDPIFILHHLMLDCMFEEWMERHPTEGYPTSSLQNNGHLIDDYLVPLFPLWTHREMFVPGSDFGYSCKLPNVTTSAATQLSHLAWCLLLLMALLTVVF